MTAWAESPDGPPDLLLDCLRRQIDERPAPVRLVAAVELIVSMNYLCGSLLLLREAETGISTQATLRALGLHYAQD
jgi:hypothetical protein